MQYGRSCAILALINLLCLSQNQVKGKPVEHQEDIKDTIKGLRHEIHKVQHFIDHLSQDVIHNKESQSKVEKSRSGIPYQRQLNHLLADESVIKATAQKAAKAVASSEKATLKTQKGVKQIAEGLLTLKKCLDKFENTITM